MLHDRESHTEDIGLLERSSPNHLLRNLSRDRHDRNGIHIGVRNAGNQVGRPRPGSCHTDAWPSGRSSIAFSSKTAALFVSWENGPDFGGPRQRLMDRHAGSARISEDYLYTLSFHGSDEHLGAVHRFAPGRSLTCNGRFVGGRSLHNEGAYYKWRALGDQSIRKQV